VLDGDVLNANFGTCVASAGDINGDGFGDVLIGAAMFETGRGKVFLYHGCSNGLEKAPRWTCAGENEKVKFGASCAALGDVNGDGYDDVIVSSYSAGTNDSPKGRVYVFFGSKTGFDATEPWTFDGEYDGESLGDCVASAGDVNGDGFKDVIVCSTPDSDPP